MWGSEEHVRELFGDGVESLETTRKEHVERADSLSAYCDFVKATFGPVIAIYASFAGEPERAAALDGDFLEFVTREPRAARRSRGAPPQYLLVVGRREAHRKVKGEPSLLDGAVGVHP